MNSGEAISAAVLIGLLAGELHELATAPEDGPSVHALSTAHSVDKHLHYELPKMPGRDVTVQLTGQRMNITAGTVQPVIEPAPGE